jgi:hypothetical protein
MASILFDDFLMSMADAVAETNKHLQQVQQDMGHFEERDGALAPKTMKMVLPRRHVADGQAHEEVHEVPTATLTHQNHVLMDKLSLDFQCLIEGMANAPRGGKPKIALVLGGAAAERRDLATVRVSFRCADPPEGTSRVNDQLLKKF